MGLSGGKAVMQGFYSPSDNVTSKSKAPPTPAPFLSPSLLLYSRVSHPLQLSSHWETKDRWAQLLKAPQASSNRTWTSAEMPPVWQGGASLVAQTVPESESACNAGDLGSIPGLGRSPGEGNGNPLQYSGLENSMDRPWGHRESDMTEWRSPTHSLTHGRTDGNLVMDSLFNIGTS